MTVNEKDNGKTISLTPAQKLEIHLPENPSTGFAWHMQNAGAPTLALSETDYIRGDLRPGSGGTRRWFFFRLGSGIAHIVLYYIRSWETKSPIQTYQLTVVEDHD